MNSSTFESMYQKVIQADYGSDTKLANRLLNFGGKDKLRHILFDAEKILTVAEAWKSSKSFSSFMMSLVLDDMLVLTNRRFLFLGKRMFGTLVTEVPLKKAMSSMKWRDNHLHIEAPEEELDIYVTDECIDNVKAVLYGDYTEDDYNKRFKPVEKPKPAPVAKNETNEIFERKLKASNDGDPLAMMEISVAYDEGNGVKKDNKKAWQWLIKAAETGNAKAMFEISCRYISGDKVEQDAKKSLEWCLKAAENEYAPAMILLAFAYSTAGEADGYIEGFSDYFKSTKKNVLLPASSPNRRLVEYDLEKAITLVKKLSDKNYKRADEWLQILSERAKKEAAQNSANLNLVKGQRVDLTKTNPGLKNLLVELGWRAANGFDIDAATFLLGTNGKVNEETDFIFYNNPLHDSAAVEHLDASSDDNERFRIALEKIPTAVTKIAFTLTIHDAATRKQNFGQVVDAFIRLCDENGKEILRYELGKNFSTETAIVVAEIYRHKSEWKFNAIGAGFSGGLAAMCKNFGIDVAS